jgi:hypothetical protein
MSFSIAASMFSQTSQRTSGGRIASSIVSVLSSAPSMKFTNPLPVLEHGSATHRQMALEHLVAGLLDFATHEQGTKSITKALKEGGKETLDRIIARMCEQSKGYAPKLSKSTILQTLTRCPSGRRAIIVDLALSIAGSQLIATVLPNVRGYVSSRQPSF